MSDYSFEISGIEIGKNRPILIAGPCAAESVEMVLETAGTLKDITARANIPFIFKASYDKANRLSISSSRGMGFPKGLLALKRVKDELDLPVITDVHETYQVEAVASVVDIIQIPAFLCRQTDLVLAAAASKKAVNIKKGQFLTPCDMKYIAEKVKNTGNNQIILTERGTSFGYGDLILDPRSIIWMKEFGYPVLLDITHTAQKTGGEKGFSGGDRNFVIPFGKVGMALGVDGIYMEVHPDPDNAISDKQIQVPLDDVERYINEIFML